MRFTRIAVVLFSAAMSNASGCSEPAPRTTLATQWRITVTSTESFCGPECEIWPDFATERTAAVERSACRAILDMVLRVPHKNRPFHCGPNFAGIRLNWPDADTLYVVLRPDVSIPPSSNTKTVRVAHESDLITLSRKKQTMIPYLVLEVEGPVFVIDGSPEQEGVHFECKWGQQRPEDTKVDPSYSTTGYLFPGADNLMTVTGLSFLAD